MSTKIISIEDLDKVLMHPNIVQLRSGKFSEELFERQRSFQINQSGQVFNYVVEWYKNISYLYVGGVQVPFHTVVQSGTWPNRKKLNLQFYYHGEVAAILGIEDY